MALLNCPECGKEISDQALSCPHCGYPLQQDSMVVVVKKKSPGRGFGIAGLVLGILGVVYSWVFLLSAITGNIQKEMVYFNIPPLLMIAIFGILALVFGIIARKQGHKATKSSAAITMGIITIAACLAILLIAIL
ncbi:MAG: zinc ribbon domain-containing protein [Oscillospiraceae bacterium]|nr:zinc ribbon domain-containing protein [Oscillospiraceae bacterium]